MIQHELNEDDGILLVAPQGPLEADDFQALAAEVDTPTSSAPAGFAAS